MKNVISDKSLSLGSVDQFRLELLIREVVGSYYTSVHEPHTKGCIIRLVFLTRKLDKSEFKCKVVRLIVKHRREYVAESVKKFNESVLIPKHGKGISNW